MSQMNSFVQMLVFVKNMQCAMCDNETRDKHDYVDGGIESDDDVDNNM